MQMTVEEVLARLQEPDYLEALRPRWAESLATPSEGLPSFLDPAEFKASRRYGGLPEDSDLFLEATASRVKNDPALLRLARHCYYRLFDPQDGEDFSHWPRLERALGDLGGAFYLLVALAIVPRIRSVHRSLGVPETVTHDTCQVLACLSGNHGRIHEGRPGILLKEMGWVWFHLSGKLFRIGRLEYMIRPFSGCVRAYRNSRTDEVIALATDGTQFNAEGYIDRTSASGAPPGGWQATLANDDTLVRGFPVSPSDGRALHRVVSLGRAEWKLVLDPGQPVLEMHIPEGGNMTPDRCIDSMRRGFRFFAEYFPDQQPLTAMQCHSWIFDPQLEAFLPPSANLVRFLKEVYLFPAPENPDGLYYIFGYDDIDPSTAPRDTSLQRSTLDFLATGRRLRGGGMFFLKQDLDQFGTQYYRSHVPVLICEDSSQTA